MLECIEHTQKGSRTGYGSTRYKGVRVALHRLAYCKANGITPLNIKGRVVRHTCDNPRCINPEHLVLGTQQDNIEDMMHRGRHISHQGVKNGQAKLTEQDVHFIREHYVRNSRTWGTVAIARMLGVNYRTVHSVTSGTAWTHM